MGFGKDGKGAIITHADIITLSTLATNTALKQDAPLAITEDFRLIKMEIAAWLANGTVGEGPIHLYLVNDELTVAEIAECILNAGPLDRNDRVAQERAERAVFLVGTFGNAQGASDAVDDPLRGADGQEGVVNKTIRWTFSDPEGWSLVAFNQSGGTLTTGGVVRMVCKFFGVWVT